MGPTNFLPHFLPPSLDRILVKYQQWAFARLQCDRIRRLFKVLVHNFLFNGSPNIRWMFDQFWKSNILSKAAVVATLCKQLLDFLGYFLFQHLVTLLAFSADSFNTRWEYFVGRLLSSPSLGAQIIHICVVPNDRPVNTHHWGMYHCTAGLQFNKTGIDQKANLSLFECVEAVESKLLKL